MSPQVINGFTVTGELGRGAFGTVYRVVKDGETRALKEITATSNVAIEAAREEARIMRGLDHPNIVTFYSFFIANQGHAYMAMELLNGREVFDIIVDDNEFESLTEMVLKQLIHQICSGLAYLHGRAIAHLDLKPENLIASKLGYEFNCKIVDFGIAQELTPDTLCPNGTDGYRSPEQISFDLITDKADMWALGCVAYEMMSGFPAFDFVTTLDYAKKAIGGEWTMTFETEDFDEDDVNPFDQISTKAKDFISSLIHVDPAKRMSAKEALNHEWLNGITDSGVLSPPDTSRRSKIFALLATKKNLRKIQARRKWRNAINVVIAMGRITRFCGGTEGERRRRDKSCRGMPVDEKYEILCLICKRKWGDDFDPETEIERFVHANN